MKNHIIVASIGLPLLFRFSKLFTDALHLAGSFTTTGIGDESTFQPNSAVL